MPPHKKVPVRKSWGQHFLRSPHTAGRIAAMVPAKADETVLEIGPGRGALTRPLLERDLTLLVVERDPLLAKKWLPVAGLTAITGDILKVGPELLLQHGPLHVIANLPYNISTPLLALLWRQSHLIRSAVLMMQKEVGMRLLAKPGEGDYGSLSVVGQAVWHWEKLLALGPAAFTPPPKVDSIVLRGTPRPNAPRGELLAKLETIARTLFHQRRKKISNTLPPLLAGDKEAALRLLSTTGTAPDLRPEKVPVASYLAWAEQLLQS